MGALSLSRRPRVLLGCTQDSLFTSPILQNDYSMMPTEHTQVARLAQRRTLAQKVRDDVLSAWTYLTNHRHQMDYPAFTADALPIGSGVTEAASKTLVKQRLCASGMRWKDKGTKIVLSLRALTHTAGRWAQFWQKVNQFGAECCC
jgi:hypothetical protein